MTGTAPRWRHGNHQPRNLYLGEQVVGLVDTIEIARAIVVTMNAAIDRQAEVARPSRCSTCGRSARQLEPVSEDVDGQRQVVAWLGPSCHRRYLDGRRDAIAMPLGGAR